MLTVFAKEANDYDEGEDVSAARSLYLPQEKTEILSLYIDSSASPACRPTI